MANEGTAKQYLWPEIDATLRSGRRHPVSLEQLSFLTGWPLEQVEHLIVSEAWSKMTGVSPEEDQAQRLVRIARLLRISPDLVLDVLYQAKWDNIMRARMGEVGGNCLTVEQKRPSASCRPSKPDNETEPAGG
jgi:hypothetical protein